MFGDDGNPRVCYFKYLEWLNAPEQKNLIKRKEEAENVFRRTGITFNVYSEKEETEKEAENDTEEPKKETEGEIKYAENFVSVEHPSSKVKPFTKFKSKSLVSKDFS